MLIDHNGGFDRAAIMAKAHHEFRLARMRGDTRGFGYWLAFIWRVAKSRRAAMTLPILDANKRNLLPGCNSLDLSSLKAATAIAKHLGRRYGPPAFIGGFQYLKGGSRAGPPFCLNARAPPPWARARAMR